MQIRLRTALRRIATLFLFLAFTWGAQAQSLPIDVSLSLSDDAPALGQQVTVKLEVTPSIDLYDTVVQFETEGGITLQGGGQINVGALTADETTSYSTQAELSGEGKGIIRGRITAAEEHGGQTFGMKRARYLLIYSEQTYVSFSFTEARIDSLRQATSSKAKAKSTQEALKEITTIEVKPDTTSGRAKSAEGKAENTSLSGTIEWTDKSGGTHGLPFTEVEVFDENENILADDKTDENGTYQVSIPQSADKIFIRVETKHDAFQVKSPSPLTGTTLFGSLYRAESKPAIEVPRSGVLSLIIPNTTERDRAFSVHAAMIEAVSYARNLNNGSYLDEVDVEYPASSSLLIRLFQNVFDFDKAGSYYCGDGGPIDLPISAANCIQAQNDARDFISIERSDAFDWDVIHHEYGHHISAEFSLDKSPGGPHSFSQNLIGTEYLDLKLTELTRSKDQGTRLAWGEGLATYLGLLIQRERNLGSLNISSVGNTSYEDDGIKLGNIEINSNFQGISRGEDDELSVSSILWDLYDEGVESRGSLTVDDVQLGDQGVWNILTSSNPVRLSGFLNSLTSNKPSSTKARYGAIFTEHNVAPSPDPPPGPLPPDGGGVTLRWEANGGGPSFRNNEFRVKFYTSDFSNLLYESPLITTGSSKNQASYKPSSSTFRNEIFDGTDEARWVVEAKQTDPPETGPYLSRARTLVKTDCPFTASISNLDGQLKQVPGTPAVFAGVDVEENGSPAQGLDRSDFSVAEDGRLITNFGFNRPSQSGSRLADIVFIVDNSGSMGPEQGDVESNIRAFVDALIANNVDFALGLTRYGQSGDGGRPIIENNGVLVQDANQFKNDILSRNRTSGAREPGYHAIVQSASQFAFRPGSKKIFVIATDERPDQGYSSQSDALNALTNNDITLYASTRSSLNGRFRSLTDATGGQIFGIRQDFSSVANSITSQVSSTYVLSYLSPTPFLGGVVENSREVTVSVSGQDCVVTASDTYVPGNVPLVKPTTATSNLSNQAQPNNSNLTISASIATFSGPSIQSAQLFYRTASSNSAYSSVSMQPASNASSSVTAKGSSKAAPVVYEATIPASDVQSPGLDYYITVSDGQSTVTTPSTDPQSNPLQVAVLPNEPPQIAHTKPTTLLPQDPVRIGAEVTDATNALTGVNLFYRQRGQITYTELTMDNPSGDTYRATIPGEDVTEFGIEYYIQATDDFGVSNTIGTADDPVLVEPSAPCVASDFTEVVNDAERRVEITIEDANGISSASFTDDQGNPFLNNLDVSLVSATDQNGNPVDFTRDTPGDDVFWSAGDANSQPAEVVMHLKQADPSVAEAGYFLRTTNDCGVTTVIDPPHNFEMEVAPAQFSLDGNYPNPFSGRTTFQIGVPAREHVTLTVYDVMGRRVATVMDKAVPAGIHQITWQGRSNGQPLSSGIYFYRIEAGDFVQTRRMTLVR